MFRRFPYRFFRRTIHLNTLKIKSNIDDEKLGRLYLSKHYFREARQYIEPNKYIQDYHFLMGLICQNTYQFKEAINHFKQDHNIERSKIMLEKLSNKTDKPNKNEQMGKLYLDKHDFINARLYIEPDKEIKDYHFLMGLICEGMYQFQEAYIHFEKDYNKQRSELMINKLLNPNLGLSTSFFL